MLFPGECVDSYQCDNGNDMCNFDYGGHGFCESCAHFNSAEDCQATGFITARGFDNCIDHCAGGENPNGLEWIDERGGGDDHFDDGDFNDDYSPWFPDVFYPGECDDSYQCDNGNDMCNFDYDQYGFCESCAKFNSAEDCQAAGFITARGFDNCIDYCAGGVNPTGLDWIDERGNPWHEDDNDHHDEDNFNDDYNPWFPDYIHFPGECFASHECNNGYDMCNFDFGDHGFCQSCEHYNSAEDCQGSGFITRFGFENCVQHCVGGYNPNGIDWIDESNTNEDHSDHFNNDYNPWFPNYDSLDHADDNDQTSEWPTNFPEDDDDQYEEDDFSGDSSGDEIGDESEESDDDDDEEDLSRGEKFFDEVLSPIFDSYDTVDDDVKELFQIFIPSYLYGRI